MSEHIPPVEPSCTCADIECGNWMRNSSHLSRRDVRIWKKASCPLLLPMIELGPRISLLAPYTTPQTSRYVHLHPNPFGNVVLFKSILKTPYESAKFLPPGSVRNYFCINRAQRRSRNSKADTQQIAGD